MLRELGGNAESVEAWKKAVGKTIAAVTCEDDLRFLFTDGTRLTIADHGQSCCEQRYFQSDDDLSPHCGAQLLDAEIKNAPNEPDEYGEHEVQFLEVITSAGHFTVAAHVEHNGYYGGFAIEARSE